MSKSKKDSGRLPLPVTNFLDVLVLFKKSQEQSQQKVCSENTQYSNTQYLEVLGFMIEHFQPTHMLFLLL